MNTQFNPKRARLLTDIPYKKGPIVYWMNRDMRVHHNWALIFAQQWAIKEKVELIVIYNLVPDYQGGGFRQFTFKINGLKEIENTLFQKNIGFKLIQGEETEKKILKYIETAKIGGLVTDFCPLKISSEWVQHIQKNISIPFYQIDAHNIIPCWIASPKQEFGAYTIRPKIHKQLDTFMDEYPSITKHPYKNHETSEKIDWEKTMTSARWKKNIPPINWIQPGEKAAHLELHNFLQNKLSDYEKFRNDPTKHAISNLSPYLHYGMISAQYIAQETQKYDHNTSAQEAFLEELIVRRELSDNYCYYNQNYDNFHGFPAWAQKTLNEHRDDPREYIYTLKEFEDAKTHDDLWNAAQKEMVITGKMHGYMRMYWAKKILEWTTSPEEAQKIALYLNDTYELDGRDPNGYVGIAWSIGGLHDRAWFDRPVFGKIRFMSYNGCKSKFDIKAYIAYVNGLQ